MAKTLHYDFTDPQWDGVDGQIDAQTGPSLDVTRASTATVTDYDNVLRTVQAAEARFTGGRRVENLCLQSENFGVTWSTANTAIIDLYAVAPDGTTTADRLIDDGGATGSPEIRVSQTITTVVNTDYTFTCYIKADQLDWAFMQVAGMASQVIDCYFDLTNGVTGASPGADVDTTYIIDVGNGWYRCGFTFGSDAVDTSAVYRIYCADADGDKNVADDGTSSILIWGAQLENVSGQDDPSPSEYIATTTAAVSKWYATKRRTNLLLQSEAFDTTWTLSRATVSGSVADPDGGTDAWSLIENTDTNSHRVYQTLATAVDGGPYVFSVYAKDVDRQWMYLTFRRIASPVDVNVWFDLSNGVVGTEDSGATGSIEDVGDGWYRCSTTVANAGQGGAPLIGLASADNTKSYAGDGAKSIYIYGAQVEKGSTATAYIATTDAVASSAVDTAITATGLLVEEARTNICLQSEDFNTTWTETNGASTFNQTTAPDGTTTADKLLDSSATGTGAVAFAQAITVVDATVYTVSVYLKADQLDWARLLITGQASNGSIFVDLTNGVLGAAKGSLNTTDFIEDVGNGWYRCGITFTSTDTTLAVDVRCADSNGDSTVALDGTSSIFVWGAQLEAGAFPTSYIPTTTVSVTRAADDITTTDVSWYDVNAGTLYANATKKAVVSQVAAIVTIDDGGATDQLFLDVASLDTRGGITNSVGNDDLVVFTDNKWNVDLTSDIAFAWAQDDIALYQDGTSATPGTSVDLPLTDAPTTLDIGQRNGSLFWNGHIAEIRYYNSRLSNATLENMSNGIFQFSGSVAGDGGHIWPPRANDPRWTQLITDSGITTTGNFIDDVHAALEAMASTTGQLDDLWGKTKTANSVTDTSEPYLY